MRYSTLLILIFMTLGILVLSALGSWQVKRLFWKEELIARVEERMSQPPVVLADIIAKSEINDQLNYRPVTTSGVFDHSRESYYYATSKNGGAGWNVHSPLRLENGKYVIVNRGFVPFDRKDPALRREGQVTGRQNVTGLIIVPETEKPNSFIPDNAMEKREFYWRDLEQLIELATENDEAEFVPLIIDAFDADLPGGLPAGSTTIVNFPNNHLQYAVTWYGLALTLLGVGGYFLYSRRQQAENDN